HLFAQATGQDKFEIFPKSSTEFFYKVVDAQINFNKNDDGKIITLTLHQGGRDITGKKKE
ncbi:MAG: serine hydrolase, partial [Saprospiraceae bacterium]